MYQGRMNIGCDIESVGTFREKWEQGQMNFFERVFSAEEIDYCKTFKDPSGHFAARFCAKEALVKAAHKECKVLVTDAQILNDSQGIPFVKAWKTRPEITKLFAENEIMVSLSHTQDMAMACVLIRKNKD